MKYIFVHLSLSAYNTPIKEGCEREKHIYYSTFATVSTDYHALCFLCRFTVASHTIFHGFLHLVTLHNIDSIVLRYQCIACISSLSIIMSALTSDMLISRGEFDHFNHGSITLSSFMFCDESCSILMGVTKVFCLSEEFVSNCQKSPLCYHKIIK